MLDAVATIILAGMMFLPIINLVVGTVAGTCLFGVAGGFAGAALAFLITIAGFTRGLGKPAALGQLVAAMEKSFFTKARNEEAPWLRLDRQKGNEDMDQAFQPNTVAEVANATMTEVAEAALDQYDNVLVMVRRNPFLSVAIAAGVGFSLALMLR